MEVVFTTPYGPFGGDRTTPKAFEVGSATPNSQKGVAKTLSLQSISFANTIVIRGVK